MIGKGRELTSLLEIWLYLFALSCSVIYFSLNFVVGHVSKSLGCL